MNKTVGIVTGVILFHVAAFALLFKWASGVELDLAPWVFVLLAQSAYLALDATEAHTSNHLIGMYAAVAMVGYGMSLIAYQLYEKEFETFMLAESVLYIGFGSYLWYKRRAELKKGGHLPQHQE